MAKQGATAAIFALLIGINFAIPSQANIGYMIIEAFADALPIEPLLRLMPMFKLSFNLVGVVIIIVDITYIIEQAKKGNF